MSWFGKLLGTDKALETTIKSVSNGLDALVYTDEERAQDAAQERKEARSMVIGWMEATQGQNIARRIIALSITATWLGMYVSSIGLNIASIWFDNTEKLLASAEAIKDTAGQVDGAMMLILGFYFAASHIDKIAGVAMNKFSKKDR